MKFWRSFLTLIVGAGLTAAGAAEAASNPWWLIMTFGGSVMIGAAWAMKGVRV